MKRSSRPIRIDSVVDPKAPWRLPSLFRGFPKYRAKMSPSQWKGLLAKAETGDAEAEWLVAHYYDDGCKDRRGRVLVRVSDRKAIAWYRRSAEHGCAAAQNTLGVILGGHYGVKRDFAQALLWLKKAFRGGDTTCAPANIGVTYRDNGNLSQAVRWFRKIDASLDESVLIQLGVHLYWGKGIRIDHEAAVRCFRKVVRGRNVSECDRDDANFFLGIAYVEGKGVRRSVRMAKQHFEKANRDDDHLAAQRILKQFERLS